MSSNYRQLLEIWFERVWHDNNIDAIDDLMDFSAETAGLRLNKAYNADEFKYFRYQASQLINNIKFSIVDFVEQHDSAAAYYTIEGTSTTGTKVSTVGSVFFSIKDGRLANTNNQIDFMPLCEQLGLLPNNWLETGLQGIPIIKMKAPEQPI